jgi:hypothetical protein
MMKNRDSILTRKCKGNGPTPKLRRGRKGGTEAELIETGYRLMNGFVHVRIRPFGLYFEHNNEPLNLVKVRGSIYKLNDCQVLK